MLYQETTGKIINAFYTVYNELGRGFLEKIYEKALMIELEKLGLDVKNQEEIQVFYKKISIGLYRADIIVEDKVIIEIKAVSKLNKGHEAQLINYLKGTGKKVGLLVNFGEKLEFKRRIFEKNY